MCRANLVIESGPSVSEQRVRAWSYLERGTDAAAIAKEVAPRIRLPHKSGTLRDPPRVLPVDFYGELHFETTFDVTRRRA